MTSLGSTTEWKGQIARKEESCVGKMVQQLHVRKKKIGSTRRRLRDNLMENMQIVELKKNDPQN